MNPAELASKKTLRAYKQERGGGLTNAPARRDFAAIRVF